MTGIQKALAATERLYALLKDPEPGLFTWQEMVQQARADINAAFEE